MTIVVLYIALLALLFAAAYITKRRFGVLGLALAAGYVLSGFWTDIATNQMRRFGVEIDSLLTVGVVTAAIILLPAALLLSSGPTYRSPVRRVIGAAMFAGLAVAFLIEPLQSMLVFEGDARTVYDFFTNNRPYIITAGLVAALVDVWMTHTSRAYKEKPKH